MGIGIARDDWDLVGVDSGIVNKVQGNSEESPATV